MRGTTSRQVTMLGVIDPEELIPTNHPIRRIRPLVEAALVELEPTFERMYAENGRPSIPHEHLLKSCLLMALYSIRSERQFCERLRYDLLFKWFLDLNVEDEPFDHSSFAKNRERLLDHRVSRQFFEAVVAQAKRRHLLSSQHFTVDGTLLESWASMKSLRPRRGDGPGTHPGGGGKNADVDFRGQRRANETHYSTTDPEARMARKGLGKETRLCFTGHVLMENRHGLAVDVELTPATGTSEREAAMTMLQRRVGRWGRCTLGADKGYDTREFVDRCRAMGVAPHIAMRESWWANGHLARLQGTAGYQVSQRRRKRVEEIFGWAKTVGGGRKLRYLGVERNRLWVELTAAAFNLVRMSNLVAVST
ncbi:MAG TPA: IS5 family transposase [Candidatus Nanopelagicaceae bacterium]|nr:IS5 family transposase [Candidatus Nanopelagicaceae bacterium]